MVAPERHVRAHYLTRKLSLSAILLSVYEPRFLETPGTVWVCMCA